MNRSFFLLGAVALSALVALSGTARADSIAVTNPNFVTDTSGWNVAHSYGSAGAYDSVNNPLGSTSSSPYNAVGGETGENGYPVGVTTAGGFINDAGDVTNPSNPNPPSDPNGANISATSRDINGNLNWSTVRISSGNGDLGSFYQDTGVVFQAGTTYTLSAYASGNAGQTGLEAPGSPSPFSNTGVGLSGTSPLTMSEISASPGVYNNWGYSAEPTLVERSITIDTANPAYQALVGQDIIVNLLADTIATGGGVAQSFTGVSLTAITDVPEPASAACVLLGISTLALRRRSARIV
jgi:hypothetical protein